MPLDAACSSEGKRQWATLNVGGDYTSSARSCGAFTAHNRFEGIVTGRPQPAVFGDFIGQ